MAFQIRDARPDDVEIIVDYNLRLAAETEDKYLDRETLRQGVAQVLGDGSKGRYFVACAGDEIVGQLMITYEWSDWRNGNIWWFQSVYVREDCRRQGVFRALFHHVEQKVREEPDVVGVRLYVENANDRAQATYENLGLRPGGYHVMERFDSA